LRHTCCGSETTRKEPEFEAYEKQRDDLNVEAVICKN